jgi:hypothetical protein
MQNFIFIKITAMLFISLSLVSCGGQKPMIDDVKVSTEIVDDDLYLSIGASLSIGNVQLPQTTLPILMPKSWEEIGTISMTPAIGGQNFLDIDVNISAISKLQAFQATLPNGSVLPLLANNQVIQIPVGKGVELYLTLGNGVAAIGAAIPFKTFDAMGSKVGTSSFFPVFNIDNIFGAAGIYTSKEAGKNGFGLFVDLSNVLDPIDFIDLGSARLLKSASVDQKRVKVSSLNYSSIVPSSRKEKKINKELFKMHRSRRRLRLH